MPLFRRSRLKVEPGTGLATRCPYCKDEFTAGGDESVKCASCGATSHSNCWEQNLGCAVFGCSSHTRLFAFSISAAPMPRVFSWKDVAAGTSSWCASILGLAFLMFLPVTMTSMLALSADDFRQWILSTGYLAGSLALASAVVAVIFRGGLRDRSERAGFAIAILLMLLCVWCAGDLWAHARLPY
jgi:Prokaryotic RING finger family 1